MDWDLSAWPWASLTPAGLLAICVGMILTGVLVPKATITREQAAYDKRAVELREEATLWRTAYEASERARGESTHQTTSLLEYARTADALLKALGAQATNGGVRQ